MSSESPFRHRMYDHCPSCHSGRVEKPDCHCAVQWDCGSYLTPSGKWIPELQTEECHHRQEQAVQVWQDEQRRMHEAEERAQQWRNENEEPRSWLR